MDSLKNIELLAGILDRQIHTINSTMDLDRICDCFIKLGNMILDTENEDMWYIELGYSCGLSDLITGAYWFFTDYHRGQYSLEYSALSVLGQIFNPGMASLEKDSPEYMTYKALESIVQEYCPLYF